MVLAEVPIYIGLIFETWLADMVRLINKYKRYLLLSLCCDADQRKTLGTQKVWWKNIYIKVTETKYKWAWLNIS